MDKKMRAQLKYKFFTIKYNFIMILALGLRQCVG